MLQTLLSQLDQQKVSQQKSYNGLFHGQSGKAIIYRLAAEQTKEQAYYDKLLVLIDEIASQLSSEKQIDFENGVAGIGFTAEWLAQRGLAENTNIQNIINRTDGVIYHNVSYAADEHISRANGTLGKLFYFLKRGEKTTPQPNDFKYVCLLTSIVNLTDDLHYRISESHCLQAAVNKTTGIIDTGNIIHIASDIEYINTETVNVILTNIFQTAGMFLSMPQEELTSFADMDRVLDKIYLSICLYHAANKRNQNKWHSLSSAFINQLPELDKLLIRNNDLLLKKLKIYTLLYTELGLLEYQEKAKVVLLQIDYNSLPSSFYQGLGTVIICYLALFHPVLTHNWTDLIFL